MNRCVMVILGPLLHFVFYPERSCRQGILSTGHVWPSLTNMARRQINSEFIFLQLKGTTDACFKPGCPGEFVQDAHGQGLAAWLPKRCMLRRRSLGRFWRHWVGVPVGNEGDVDGLVCNPPIRPILTCFKKKSFPSRKLYEHFIVILNEPNSI